MYASKIEHVFYEKDLGITIDSELTFEDHISRSTSTFILMMEKYCPRHSSHEIGRVENTISTIPTNTDG